MPLRRAIGALLVCFADARFGDREGFARYLRAESESFGYFYGVTDSDWCMLKHRAQSMAAHLSRGEPQAANAWYQDNWEPVFTCLHETRQGHGDEYKWLCDPHRLRLKACVVYSIGSNNQFGFEEAVLRDIGAHCDIHTFDHTSLSTNKPARVTFHPWGLAHANSARLKSLPWMQKALGHTHVDVLKIDCEGCEFTSYHNWFDFIHPTQVLVEVHQGTSGAMPVVAERFMQFMRAHGYAVFHKEPNIKWGGGQCVEYAFVRLAPAFWQEKCSE